MPVTDHGPFRRAALCIAVACVSLGGMPVQAQTSAQPPAASPVSEATTNFDIDAQPLADALVLFSRQSRQQLLFSDAVVAGKMSIGVNGTMTTTDAMRKLLTGTGLAFERTASGGMMVADPSKLSSAAIPGDPLPPAQAAPVAQSGAAKTQSKRPSTIVEEIMVTARKREESVQDIPIAITAFSAADLKSAGIRNLADMEGVVPGVNMGGGGNGVKKDSNPFIRGVGQRETKVTLDPAVGTYIDGIYLSRTAGAMLDTVGVERVEVLRGPQGTLFGKNTTGGAISVTTIKPHEEFGASITANVGNYGRSDGSFVLNVPIIEDTLLSRLTVSSKNSEGYFTNINDNTKWGDDNRITGIGQLRWLPSDNLMFDLLAERTRIREKPRPQKCAKIREYDATGNSNPNSGSYNPNYFAPTPVRSINSFRAESGLPSLQELCEQSEALPQDKFSSDLAEGDPLLPEGRYWVDTSTLGLTGEWDIGTLGPISNAQLKSITSWRKVEQIADEDLDAVGAPYLIRIQPDFSETTSYSQEFQFNGSAMDDRLFFSTGLYYFQEETPEDQLLVSAGFAQQAPTEWPEAQIPFLESLFGVDIIGNTTYGTGVYEGASEILRTDNKTYAWYGQANFDITSQVQVTAGLRYTKEERWSRYEKAYALSSSIADGEIIQGLIAPGLSTFSHTLPGYSPMLEWLYGSPVRYSIPAIPGIEGNYPGDELKTTDEAWTPMISLKYQLNDQQLGRFSIDDAMFYATYSEGFHSGGVTAGAIENDGVDENFIGDPGFGVADPIIFEPETVQNYEVGFKLQAFDRRIQANVAVFYMDYTDMQLTSSGNRDGIPVPFVENAGKSVIQGFEGEFVFMPTMNWRIMLNTAYTDADIKEWDAAQIELQAASGQPASGEITYIDRSDEPMPRVPRWQAFLLTDYTFNLPDGGYLTPSIAARYTSEIYHGFDRGSFIYGKDVVTSDAATFLDGRISYISADEKMEIALWGKNLTDRDDYLVGGIPLADVTGATGQIFANPRTFGLEMTYRFGAE